jgi:hypothetical protein
MNILNLALRQGNNSLDEAAECIEWPEIEDDKTTSPELKIFEKVKCKLVNISDRLI